MPFVMFSSFTQMSPELRKQTNPPWIKSLTEAILFKPKALCDSIVLGVVPDPL